MKYSLAFEGRESHEGFCHLLHLVKIILLKNTLFRPVPVLRAKDYEDSLKPLKLIKKGKFIYAGSQQCRQIHI